MQTAFAISASHKFFATACAGKKFQFLDGRRTAVTGDYNAHGAAKIVVVISFRRRFMPQPRIEALAFFYSVGNPRNNAECKSGSTSETV